MNDVKVAEKCSKWRRHCDVKRKILEHGQKVNKHG